MTSKNSTTKKVINVTKGDKVRVISIASSAGNKAKKRLGTVGTVDTYFGHNVFVRFPDGDVRFFLRNELEIVED